MFEHGYGYETDRGYDEEAHARDLHIVWCCESCGREHEEPPGYDVESCRSCGGRMYQAGESYLAEPRW